MIIHCFSFFTGDKFKSGQEFCEAQQFEVIEGENQCFKFDPTVFDRSAYLTANVAMIMVCGVSSVIFKLRQSL